MRERGRESERERGRAREGGGEREGVDHSTGERRLTIAPPALRLWLQSTQAHSPRAPRASRVPSSEPGLTPLTTRATDVAPHTCGLGLGLG